MFYLKTVVIVNCMRKNNNIYKLTSIGLYSSISFLKMQKYGFSLN